MKRSSTKAARTGHFRALALVTVTLSLCQCIQGDGPGSSEPAAGSHGSARVPLSTFSNAGARYRLIGTFEITGPESHSLTTSDEATELVIDLTVGDYEIELLSGWVLRETFDDGSSSVVTNAVRTCPNPQSFSITNQETTPLSFTFQVGDDVIAFGEGRGEITTEVEEEEQAIAMSAGASHTCALLESGGVRCWGYNSKGQLGQGNIIDIGDDEPPNTVPVVNLGGVAIEVVCGANHSCAVLEDGLVYCWGFGDYAQLGYGNLKSVGDDEPPTDYGPVLTGAPVIGLAAGGNHTCALLEHGALRCWGLNTSGQLGLGHTTMIGDNEKPEDVDEISFDAPIIEVVAGTAHTCALTEEGAVHCWGDNSTGQLGYGNTENIGDDEVPRSAGAVELGEPAIAIAAGGQHSCALLESGAVRCWGKNSVGQLGLHHTDFIGDDELPYSVDPVNVGDDVVDLDAGESFVCALLSSGALRCWGYNDHGQLGYGNTLTIGDDEHPADAGDTLVTASALTIALGSEHGCVTTTGDAVRCWGRNSAGQLGYGHTETIGDDESPSAVGTVQYR